MNLTFDQIRKYFEARLNRSLPPRDKVAVLCPFHDDRSPSATVFLSGNGGFNCNGCQVKGNTFQFEARLSKCDPETARKNIAEIIGADMGVVGSIGRCTAVYDFRKGGRRRRIPETPLRGSGGRKNVPDLSPRGQRLA